MNPTKVLSTIFYCFLVTLLFRSEKLAASHAMGAALTYECLGSNQYRLTYSFYRDCDGIFAPASINVAYTSACYPGSLINLVPTAGSPTQIANVCPSFITTCNGGTYTGIEEWIYTAVINLPGPCADWTFSYAECCRNSAITTVDNVGSYNLYVFSLLNNADGGCNNSPVFVMPPVQQVCVGQSYCFNNTAIDPDGDSLRYQLITPLAATGSPITYRFPYSYTQPIMSSPPANFNPTTGNLCVVPTQADVSPFAVLVSEYRNGVLIGQVERDIQIEALACNNFLPTLSGYDGGAAFSAVACPNVPNEFFISSADYNGTDQTSITWNSNIPTAQFSRTGGLRDTLLFTWTPTVADTANNPHCFVASVVDDHCPYFGINNYSFCFTVLNSNSPTCILLSTEKAPAPSVVGVSRSIADGSYKFSWDKPGAFTFARIFDSSGRLVQEFSIGRQQTASLNLSGLSSGIYHVCLDGDEHWRKRVVWE